LILYSYCMMKAVSENKTVLVGVLKNKNDLRILLKQHWYRIPVFYLSKEGAILRPLKKKFKYIAFYQPAGFGRRGKRIEYYARLKRRKIVKRINLLPKERNHLRANDDYLKCEFSKIEKLPKPIKNIIPRRVSFGFTTLKTLFSSHDILELYGIPPTEQIIERRLRQIGIKVRPEFTVLIKSKRFRIDFVIFCKKGKIAVECDNKKAHTGKFQKAKDRIKNSYLRRSGWRVIRLKERDIIEHLGRCVLLIQKTIKVLS